MKIEASAESYNKVKQMLINGDSYDKIMDETNVRLKDIKRIQRKEIHSKI